MIWSPFVLEAPAATSPSSSTLAHLATAWISSTHRVKTRARKQVIQNMHTSHETLSTALHIVIASPPPQSSSRECRGRALTPQSGQLVLELLLQRLVPVAHPCHLGRPAHRRPSAEAAWAARGKAGRQAAQQKAEEQGGARMRRTSKSKQSSRMSDGLLPPPELRRGRRRRPTSTALGRGSASATVATAGSHPTQTSGHGTMDSEPRTTWVDAAVGSDAKAKVLG